MKLAGTFIIRVSRKYMIFLKSFPKSIGNL